MYNACYSETELVTCRPSSGHVTRETEECGSRGMEIKITWFGDREKRTCDQVAERWDLFGAAWCYTRGDILTWCIGVSLYWCIRIEDIMVKQRHDH